MCAVVAMLAMMAVTIMLVGDDTSTSTVLEAKAAQQEKELDTPAVQAVKAKVSHFFRSPQLLSVAHPSL